MEKHNALLQAKDSILFPKEQVNHLQIKKDEKKTKEICLRPKKEKKIRESAQIRVDDESELVEVWDRAQIKKLFELYDYYGPQWKVISEQMKNSEFSKNVRCGNSVKNRFYTTLRNLLKFLFRKKAGLCPKIPYQIPSKEISKIYDGRQGYTQYYGFLRSLILEIDYDLSNSRLRKLIDNHSEAIPKIFQKIYNKEIDDGGQELINRPNSEQNPVNNQNQPLNSTQRAERVRTLQSSHQQTPYYYFFVYPFQPSVYFPR